MTTLDWQCHRFDQLNNQQLYEIIKLRVNVFVVEQDCAYSELDDKDTHTQAHHLFASKNTEVIAYARLLPPGLGFQEASLGRFVVKQGARRQGLGSELMRHCLVELEKHWPKENIRISAQVYARHFYEHYGFVQDSDEYLEDGIPHIEMLRKN